MARDWRTATLDAQEYAMLELCKAMTLRPSEMTDADALGVQLDPLPYDPDLVAVFDEYHDRVHPPAPA